jgi:hypothetical protein
MLSHLAQNLTYVGYFGQGRALASRALSEVRRSGHAFSIAFMSSFAALVALWSGFLDDAKHSARRKRWPFRRRTIFLCGCAMHSDITEFMTELGESQAGLEPAAAI